MKKKKNKSHAIKFNSRWIFYLIISMVFILVVFVGSSIFLIFENNKLFNNDSKTTTNSSKANILTPAITVSKDSQEKVKKVISTILGISGDYRDKNIQLENIGILGILNSFSILTTYHADRDTIHHNYSSGLTLLLLESIPAGPLTTYGPNIIDPSINWSLQHVLYTEFQDVFKQYAQLINKSIFDIYNAIFTYFGININTGGWIKPNIQKYIVDGKTTYTDLQTKFHEYSPTSWARSISDTLFKKNGDTNPISDEVDKVIANLDKTLNNASNFFNSHVTIRPLLTNLVYNLVYKVADTIDNFLFPNDTLHNYWPLSRKWYDMNSFIIQLCRAIPSGLNAGAKYLLSFFCPNNFWNDGQQFNSLCGFLAHFLLSFPDIYYFNSSVHWFGWMWGGANWDWKSFYQTFRGEKQDFYGNYYLDYYQIILKNLNNTFTLTNNKIEAITE